MSEKDDLQMQPERRDRNYIAIDTNSNFEITFDLTIFFFFFKIHSLSDLSIFEADKDSTVYWFPGYIFTWNFSLLIMALVPCKLQVAGHGGPLRSADGSIFCKPSNRQEMDFYTKTQELSQKLDENSALGSNLIDWMPVYMGTLSPGMTSELKQKTTSIPDDMIKKSRESTQKFGAGRQFLVLSNLLFGFHRPNVIDIKLGSVLYDASADPAKVKRMKEVSKTTTSGTLSFRICGMQLADDLHKIPENIKGFEMKDVCQVNDGYLSFNRFFGRKLTDETVVQGLRLFFRYNRLSKSAQDRMINTFITRLQMFYNCLLDAEVRIVSSSLLLVYESSEEEWIKRQYEDPLIKERLADEDEEEGDNGSLSSLSYIDFAHARYVPGKGYDEELVTGVENLIDIIKKI